MSSIHESYRVAIDQIFYLSTAIKYNHKPYHMPSKQSNSFQNLRLPNITPFKVRRMQPAPPDKLFGCYLENKIRILVITELHTSQMISTQLEIFEFCSIEFATCIQLIATTK
jgi:hypothetical protein